MRKVYCFLIIVLFFTVVSSAQPRRKFHSSFDLKMQFLRSMVYQIPADSSSITFILIKVPYKNLIFVKSDTEYKASYRFNVEVYDNEHNFVLRRSLEDTVNTNDFNLTSSDEAYSENLLSFNLNEGEYTLFPIFLDHNSERDIKLDSLNVNVARENIKTLKPFLVSSSLISCGNQKYYKIENYDKIIPFSHDLYNLVIPVLDTSVSNIKVTIVNNSDTVYSGRISNSFNLNNSFEVCNNYIVLKNNPSSKKTKDFVVLDVNKMVREGELSLTIDLGDSKKKTTFHYFVIWQDKPKSLRNPELAIKQLKYIQPDKVVDSLLNFDSDDYEKVLFNYWKRYDPTKLTSFNEVMEEYYSRIDYTAENFSTISGIPGFDTDRGKIFIKYGYPKDVSRTSNEIGNVLETWLYKKPDMKFVFIDSRGTGDYKLLKKNE